MSLGQLGSIVLVSLSAYLIYFAASVMFLSYIKINKWIIAAVAIIILLVSSFLPGELPKIYSYVLSGIFVILLLWFMDLNKVNNKNTKKKEIVIKPKKKPNRVDSEKKRK